MPESIPSQPVAADAIDIAPSVRLAPEELIIRAVHASGPGGQHVNKSATRISLTWNIRNSRALSDAQRTRVLAKLGSRVDSEGAIRIVAGEYRSQQQNKRAAIERLRLLVSRALIVPKTRRPTKPTRGSVEQRLDAKRRRSQVKQQRRQLNDE